MDLKVFIISELGKFGRFVDIHYFKDGYWIFCDVTILFLFEGNCIWFEKCI